MTGCCNNFSLPSVNVSSEVLSAYWQKKRRGKNLGKSPSHLRSAGSPLGVSWLPACPANAFAQGARLIKAGLGTSEAPGISAAPSVTVPLSARLLLAGLLHLVLNLHLLYTPGLPSSTRTPAATVNTCRGCPQNSPHPA